MDPLPAGPSPTPPTSFGRSASGFFQRLEPHERPRSFLRGHQWITPGWFPLYLFIIIEPQKSYIPGPQTSARDPRVSEAPPSRQTPPLNACGAFLRYLAEPPLGREVRRGGSFFQGCQNPHGGDAISVEKKKPLLRGGFRIVRPGRLPPQKMARWTRRSPLVLVLPPEHVSCELLLEPRGGLRSASLSAANRRNVGHVCIFTGVLLFTWMECQHHRKSVDSCWTSEGPTLC